MSQVPERREHGEPPVQPANRQKLPPVRVVDQRGQIPAPTYVVRAGVWLTWSVLGLIGLLLAGLLGYLVVATPAVTAFGEPVTPDSFALYQKAADLVFQRVTTLLDLAVTRTLLPVLTLLLGYFFGTRADQAASSGQGSG